MNNQNFYLRLIALLLIIMAVFFYNGTVKDKEQAQDIADLTAKTESLEKQQDQILTALKETYEEQKTAAESNASSDVSSEADNKSEKDSTEDKENTEQADSEEADDSDKEITHNVNDLLDHLIEESVALVGKPVPLMNKEDKVTAIQFLNDAGAFLITKSGDKVANYFGISKYTLYSYIDVNK